MDGKRKRDTAVIGLAASTMALLAGAAMKADDADAVGEPQNALAKAQLGEPLQLNDLVPHDWDLPADRNERVDFFIDFLKGEKYEEMKEWMERLGRYAPMIREELRARGMPEDLLFLAMIESGLDPNAYSVAHAAGIWQFIEGTGGRYGLEVSDYVDERRDPVKATAAALTYLRELHERFDSWFLAAASYNTGENRVGRIMRENFGSERGADDDYWRIGQQLPRETRDYVPLMLAAAHIVKDPASHGFTELRFQEPLQYDEVRVPGGTSLEAVAQAAGVDAAALRDLNPHLVRGQTPPGRDWQVRVPTGSGETFAASLGAAERAAGAAQRAE